MSPDVAKTDLITIFHFDFHWYCMTHNIFDHRDFFRASIIAQLQIATSDNGGGVFESQWRKISPNFDMLHVIGRGDNSKLEPNGF